MSKSLDTEKKKKVKRPQKEIDDVIKQHLDKLDEKLGDEVTFWTFPDLKGFKRIQMNTLEQMQAYINKDVEKYKNRKVCEISTCFRHRTKDFVKRENRIWLTVSVLVLGIDDKGSLHGKKNFNNMCAVRWEEEDFRVSKLSFKLLKEIMHLVADDKHQCIDLYGIPLHKVVTDLKKKNIDISDVLSPLAGIKKYK
jgi:hypothetical protein